MKITVTCCLAALFAKGAFAQVPVQVQELIFAEQLAKNTSEFVYCLSVDGEDATAEVIARLVRDGFTIVGASKCTQNRNPRTGGSFHNDSRRKAMFVRVNDFSSENPSGATVEWSSYHHGLYGSGSKLRLALVDGNWHVVQIFDAWDS